MFTNATTTTATLVLCTAFTQFGTVMTSDTDCCNFTVLKFPGISGLIVFLTVRTQVISKAILIVIIVSESGIQASFEGLQIHGIGIKHILILDLSVIPGLGNMNLIGICLGILTASTLAQDISGRVIAHVV